MRSKIEYKNGFFGYFIALAIVALVVAAGHYGNEGLYNIMLTYSWISLVASMIIAPLLFIFAIGMRGDDRDEMAKPLLKKGFKRCKGLWIFDVFVIFASGYYGMFWIMGLFLLSFVLCLIGRGFMESAVANYNKEIDEEIADLYKNSSHGIAHEPV